MREFSALIIGLGDVGLGYDLRAPDGMIFTHTKACLAHPCIRLVGGVDPDPTARAAFESYAGVKAYSDLESRQWQKGDIDIIIVSTPTEVRETVVQQCQSLHPQALLLEKPIAKDVEQANAIIRMCKEQNVLLGVNYFRRCDKVIMSIPSLADQKHFGALRHVTCYYSGGLLTNASHYVDLLVSWFGLPRVVRRLSKKTESHQEDEGVSFVLQYNAFPVFFHHLSAHFDIGEVDLLFEAGRIQLKNYGEDMECFVPQADLFFPGYKRLHKLGADVIQPGLSRYQYNVLDALVASLREGAEFPSSGESALSVLKLCLSVLQDE